jgi:ADP-L-glycero-D-manno-heptose 6-epimerase
MSPTQPLLYLVTGAAGFIGSRFVESCHRRKISVISVDDQPLFKTRPELASIDFGQVIDREDLWSWLQNQKPQMTAIVHLGAITDTRETDINQLNHLNVFYSQKLWNYASTHQIPFLYASSAATYGDGQLGYEDNEDLIPKLAPLNAYGDSKQKFDCWALDQERSGNHPSSWAGFKFFNVYGFGERHKGFMSSVVLHAYDQIQTSGKVTLFKSHRDGILDGHQKRDFIAVEDVINALHFAIEKPLQRGIYNLGTGKARTFLDLARAVFAALGRPEKIEFIDTPVVLREKYQYFTEARMERFLSQGYPHPLLTLEEGVNRYIRLLNRI